MLPMQEKRPAASSRAQWHRPQMLCVGPMGLAWLGEEGESCLRECRADSATKVSSHLGPGRDPFSHGPGAQGSQKGLGGLSAQVFILSSCRWPGPAPTARPPLHWLHCPSLSASQLLGVRAVFLAHRLLPARPFPGEDGFCLLPSPHYVLQTHPSQESRWSGRNSIIISECWTRSVVAPVEATFLPSCLGPSA